MGIIPHEEHEMENISMTLDGDILTLKVNMSQELGLSASKKNVVIASTRGNAKIPGTEASFGLNVYKKPE